MPLSRARYDQATEIIDSLLDGRFEPEMLRPAMVLQPLRGTLTYMEIQLKGLLGCQRFELRQPEVDPVLPVTPAGSILGLQTVPTVPRVAGLQHCSQPEPTDSGRNKPDGPFGPRHFRWKGNEREFPSHVKRLHRFAEATWPTFRLRQSIHIDDFNDSYKKVAGDELSIDTAENYARDLSSQLLAWFPDFPARIKREGEYLRWVDLPGARAQQAAPEA